MANTYTLIASNTLGSSAASVTFSSIPSTYTDLVLKASIRSTRANTLNVMNVRLNNLSTSIYSDTVVDGNSSSASSYRISSSTQMELNYINGANSTSNTFTNFEMYIPSYLSTTKKPISMFNAFEQNASSAGDAVIAAVAGLADITSAITEINLSNAFSASFASGSTFWLYGLKNS